MKTPAEFSPRTNLIENRLPRILGKLEKDQRRQIDESPFRDLEKILSGPIVQHNLDKHQRSLLRKENLSKNGQKRGNDGRVINPPKQKIAAQDLPELEHAFLEGIQVYFLLNLKLKLFGQKNELE